MAFSRRGLPVFERMVCSKDSSWRTDFREVIPLYYPLGTVWTLRQLSNYFFFSER
jgi:hypothetical protein